MTRVTWKTGAAVAVLTVGVLALPQAKADTPRPSWTTSDVQVFVHGGEGDVGRPDPARIDANADGFVSRAEFQAEAERMFAMRDTDKDGAIDVRSRGGPSAAAPHHHARTQSRTVIIERSGPDHHDADADDSHRGDGARPPRPPRPPLPRPMGPPLVMLIIDAAEADANKDRRLSKDEFVSHQLRFFTAADVDGDGKVKFTPPPRLDLLLDPPPPPEPPPAPPAPGR